MRPKSKSQTLSKFHPPEPTAPTQGHHMGDSGGGRHEASLLEVLKALSCRRGCFLSLKSIVSLKGLPSKVEGFLSKEAAV